ncbi:hypothetical protein SUGI_0972860 [Cryptomeria japonica]|nr:hypothetical protein SUGI_0972860 [Cryptomeria japonica]
MLSVRMENNSKRPKNISSWDCGSPLYDSYELVSIFNQLDRGLATLYPSSTPPPNRHSSWLSFNTQKLKRVSCKFISRLRISSSERESFNKNNPVSFCYLGCNGLFHREKTIASRSAGQDQIRKDAFDGVRTRKSSDSNGNLYEQNSLDSSEDYAKALIYLLRP